MTSCVRRAYVFEAFEFFEREVEHLLDVSAKAPSFFLEDLGLPVEGVEHRVVGLCELVELGEGVLRVYELELVAHELADLRQLEVALAGLAQVELDVFAQTLCVRELVVGVHHERAHVSRQLPHLRVQLDLDLASRICDLFNLLALSLAYELFRAPDEGQEVHLLESADVTGLIFSNSLSGSFRKSTSSGEYTSAGWFTTAVRKSWKQFFLFMMISFSFE